MEQINLSELESYKREAKEEAMLEIAKLCRRNRYPVAVVFYALQGLLDDLMLQFPVLVEIAEKEAAE